MNGHFLQVWRYADCSQCVPFRLGDRRSYNQTNAATLEADLRQLVDSEEWAVVVTHNQMGSYGHPQHKELYRLMSKICNREKLFVFSPIADHKSGKKRDSALWNVYATDRPNLNEYYGHFQSHSVPIADFDAETALQQCRLNFPWNCALFDCETTSFPSVNKSGAVTRKRCGLKIFASK